MTRWSRWLGFFGIFSLFTGLLVAFLLRLFFSGVLLQNTFYVDLASLILVLALPVSALSLGLAALLQWQTRLARRALYQQAAALERERRRFIQRLDHELKNPLTAIQVQLDNLQAANGNHSAITDVRAQVDRLSQLTRGLRRLADLEARPLQVERIEIGELLGEVVDLLQAPRRISLDVQQLPWPIPPIEGDRELLLMVFRNLADNALKYSRAAVQVRARHTSGALVVEVIDTGRGIVADELPLIIEELYRGSNTRDIAGSGLGLSIVQRIIERHHGKLEIRSRPEQGTIATVQLPYDQSSLS